jgi:hypothetical protein
VTATDTTKKYLIRGSYLEIYNENVRDLLGKDYKTTLELHVKYFLIQLQFLYYILFSNLNIGKS